jgi:hypothetical protein
LSNDLVVYTLRLSRFTATWTKILVLVNVEKMSVMMVYLGTITVETVQSVIGIKPYAMICLVLRIALCYVVIDVVSERFIIEGYLKRYWKFFLYDVLG